jgi:hypothetical protein
MNPIPLTSGQPKHDEPKGKHKRCRDDIGHYWFHNPNKTHNPNSYKHGFSKWFDTYGSAAKVALASGDTLSLKEEVWRRNSPSLEAQFRIFFDMIGLVEVVKVAL